MLRLAADEDFNNRILRGLLRRNPGLDIVRVQDAGLSGRGDAELLEWAATEERILLTHDVTTMKQYVDERIAAGLPMPGVFEINSGIANAPHADFAGEVLTPPLTKGNIVPSGLPYFLSATPQRADGEFQIKPRPAYRTSYRRNPSCG